ncbi:FxLYD domain-containing protein [Flavobacterium sp. UBA7680]|uniref:FxLYD domain-containing protein n=1 Tax=Flavobacterium sp. UBA7680 TaxID=1946559 RepID=UPI0025BCA70D|nr:FxLYD domain-containing protein [Flavobacterium sp. UBA7680]
MKRKVQHLFSALTLAGFIFIAFGSGDEDKKNFESNSTTVSDTENSKPDVEILKQSASYEPTLSSYTVHCRLKNNTNELIPYLDLTATFYDKEGNIVGTGMGNAANFAAGAEKTVDVIGLDIQNCETYEVEIGNVMN